MRAEYGPDWYVSWHNFADREPLGDPAYLIHDTTLRDGEQQAGVLYTIEEKVAIAKALDALGVDRIEAGMVVVSEEDQSAIRSIVDLGLEAEIWTIVRSIPDEVSLAIEAGVAGIGIILLANQLCCEVFDWDVHEAVQESIRTAEAGKAAGLRTTLLIADATRMERERLSQIVSESSMSGMFDALAVMDTFGALSPYGTGHILKMVRELTDLPIELHPHNDFGLGTANALAGVEAGAHVIHTSMLGLGERLGNTPLEQVAAAAPLIYGLENRLNLSKLIEAADLVRRSVRIDIAPHTPVVGETYSRIETGAVASEFRRWSAQGKDLQWLFPFVPSLIGAPDIELVLGKGSGLANIDDALERVGMSVSDELKRDLVNRTKAEAIRLHRLLSDAEFRALAAEVSEAG